MHPDPQTSDANKDIHWYPFFDPPVVTTVDTVRYSFSPGEHKDVRTTFSSRKEVCIPCTCRLYFFVNHFLLSPSVYKSGFFYSFFSLSFCCVHVSVFLFVCLTSVLSRFQLLPVLFHALFVLAVYFPF